MTTTPLTPAALAEIRERDAQIDAAWFDVTMDEGDKEEQVRRERDSYRDRRNLLAEVGRLTKDLDDVHVFLSLHGQPAAPGKTLWNRLNGYWEWWRTRYEEQSRRHHKIYDDRMALIKQFRERAEKAEAELADDRSNTK